MLAIHHGPGNAAEVPLWDKPASAGRLEDAVVALVKHRDCVSFVEMQSYSAPHMPTEGAMVLELKPGAVLWRGLSEELAGLLQWLLKQQRVHLHPCSTLVYWADGRVPGLPVAKSAPAAGFKRPRWVPVVFRTMPLEQAQKPRRRGPWS